MMRPVACLGLFVAIAVLAGCTPSSPTPTAAPDPVVLWDVEGTSPLEDDPAVAAARAADLARALAWNALDFGRADFVSTHTARFADKIFDAFETTYVDIGAEPRSLPGPSIWLPVSVEEAADGNITVVVCDASDHWIIEADVAPEYDLADAFLLTIVLERDGDSLLMADKRVSLEQCDATGAAVGVFEPAPIPPMEIAAVSPPS
jgi:hypothetical protein